MTEACGFLIINSVPGDIFFAPGHIKSRQRTKLKEALLLSAFFVHHPFLRMDKSVSSLIRCREARLYNTFPKFLNRRQYALFCIHSTTFFIFFGYYLAHYAILLQKGRIIWAFQ
jgi:hypothetical protein